MTVNIDADQRNADWIKTLSWEYPTDAEHFLMFIGGPEQLEHFLTLPVAEQMPEGLRVELAMRTSVRVPLKSMKFDPDQLRDRLGRWVEGGGAGGGGGVAVAEKDPMAHVKFTIGTLPEKEQKTIHETLSRLGTKYPAVPKLITSVAATPLKTRWGSINDQGKMKFTNLGRKDERYRDPLMEVTVAHEFGHALIHNLAGRTEPPQRPLPTRDAVMLGIPRDEANAAIREYNRQLRENDNKSLEIEMEVFGKVCAHFGEGTRGWMKGSAVLDQLKTEFPESTDYMIQDHLELLCQAFGHYETGRHGVIADIVGHAMEERYGVQS